MISSGALLIIGFMVENPKMSPIRMGLFYFAAGILGNLFAICITDDCSVGPMAAIMGMVSGMVSGVIVNWKALQGAGMMRICLIFMMVFIFIILLLISSGSANVGYRWEAISLSGEGGGFMAGFGLGMMLMPYALRRESPFVGMIRKIGLALTFIYAAILIPVFIFSVDPMISIWSA